MDERCSMSRTVLWYQETIWKSKGATIPANFHHLAFLFCGSYLPGFLPKSGNRLHWQNGDYYVPHRSSLKGLFFFGAPISANILQTFCKHSANILQTCSTYREIPHQTAKIPQVWDGIKAPAKMIRDMPGIELRWPMLRPGLSSSMISMMIFQTQRGKSYYSPLYPHDIPLYI